MLWSCSKDIQQVVNCGLCCSKDIQHILNSVLVLQQRHTTDLNYACKDIPHFLNGALVLQQREVLLVALVATLKSPPAGMTNDAHLQQQVMLAALQLFTFIAPGL